MSESLANLGTGEIPEPRTPEDFGYLASHWYLRYSAEPQDRNRNGKLMSSTAELFESRMNQCLSMFGELKALEKEAVLIPLDRGE